MSRHISHTVVDPPKPSGGPQSLEGPALEVTRELSCIDVIASPRIAFATVHTYRLQNVYEDGGRSKVYDFDLVVTKFTDAVVVTVFTRTSDGRISVLLRHGLRPAIMLRRLYAEDQKECSALVLELVAGGMERADAGVETAFHAAAREVLEESGYSTQPSDFVELGCPAFSSTGFAMERLHYVCVDVTGKRVAEAKGDSHPLEECQKSEFVDLAEALAMCRDGRISDNKTEVGLLRFASWSGHIPGFGI